MSEKKTKQELEDMVKAQAQDIKELKDEIKNIKKELEMLNFLKNMFNKDNSKEVESLKEEIKTLKSDLSSKDSEISKYKDEVKKLSQKLSSKDKEILELSNKNSNLQAKLDNNIISKVNKIYNSLDNSTIKGIQNIIKSNSDISVFLSGVLHLDSLWHYAAYLRREHKDSEFEKLKKIIDILLQEYKYINLDIQDVKVGDKFDSDIHTRDNRSEEMEGDIVEVVLQGYSINGELIKKSIVKVAV